MAALSADAPVFNPRPRGPIRCTFLNSSTGCRYGDSCRFLHERPGDVGLHNAKPGGWDKRRQKEEGRWDKPIRQKADSVRALVEELRGTKRAVEECRYWASGYCKHEKCTFPHPMDPSSGPQPPCGICLDDTPVTYGLLPGCSHPFCLDCITLWRSKRSDAYFSDGANMDKVIKLCPLCRQPSKYVFPSSLFWEKGQRKDAIEKNYLIIVGKVPCKYLERGIKHGKPFCPYGDDCHYSHMINGIKHKFDKGASELLSYMRGSHDGYRIEGARRRFHGRGRRGSLQPDNFPSDDDMPLEFPIIGNPLLFRNDVVLLMSSMLLDQNPETVGQAGEEDEGDDEDDEGEENDEEEEEEAEQGLEDEIYLGEGDDFEVDSLDDLGEWGYDDWDDEYDDDEEGDYPGFGPLMQF